MCARLSIQWLGFVCAACASASCGCQRQLPATNTAPVLLLNCARSCTHPRACPCCPGPSAQAAVFPVMACVLKCVTCRPGPATRRVSTLRPTSRGSHPPPPPRPVPQIVRGSHRVRAGQPGRLEGAASAVFVGLPGPSMAHVRTRAPVWRRACGDTQGLVTSRRCFPHPLPVPAHPPPPAAGSPHPRPHAPPLRVGRLMDALHGHAGWAPSAVCTC